VSRFITIRNRYGHPVLVNTAHIVKARHSNAYAKDASPSATIEISLTDGTVIETALTLEDLQSLLNGSPSHP
jgi:hypothetical protein